MVIANCAVKTCQSLLYTSDGFVFRLSTEGLVWELKTPR